MFYLAEIKSETQLKEWDTDRVTYETITTSIFSILTEI